MFAIATTVLCAFLFAIWTRGTFLNIALKITFLAMTIWGAIESLAFMGYLVRIS